LQSLLTLAGIGPNLARHEYRLTHPRRSLGLHIKRNQRQGKNGKKLTGI
jgi:hypothetical protein